MQSANSAARDAPTNIRFGIVIAGTHDTPSDATLDEVAIFDRALSAAEVAAHYAAR